MEKVVQRPDRLETSGPDALTDPALWQTLAGAAGMTERAQAWLALQSAMLGARRAVLLLRDEESERLTPRASLPPGSPPGPLLAEAIERCVEQSAPVCLEAGLGGGTAIAHPIAIGGRFAGAAGFEMAPFAQSEQALHLRTLQWGLAMLESAVLRPETPSADPATGSFAPMALQRMLGEGSLTDAARAVCTDLAFWLGCDRVSLGTARPGGARLLAISHLARFDVRLALAQALEAALGEALEHAKVMRHPEDGISGSLAEVSRALGSPAVAAIPFGGGDVRWAVCLERQRAFSEAELAALGSALAMFSAGLVAKRDAGQGAGERVLRALQSGLRRIVGPRATGLKVAVAAAAIAAVFLVFATGTYRVAGDATLEGTVRRTLAAPIDGYLMSAAARAGMKVKEGEVVAALDDRELQLERTKWNGQHAQYLRQLQEATAKHERGQANILQAQVQQAQAQIRLLDAQIARSRIMAPFDGLVVSGDLSQSIGSAVRKGQVLFEVAPLEGYRVVIHVDEGDIEGVEAGQPGTLLLASLPALPLPIRVTQVTPVTKVAEGKNVFRVEATLEAAAERVRPGMEGVGKIELGERRLAWIWTRRLVNWARLSWWRYLP